MLRPFGATFPRVHPTAFIDQSARIIGDIEIGEESSVWMNAVIRSDVNTIRIGRRTNIQDGTVIHVTDEVAGIRTYADHYVSYSRTHKE